MDGPALQKQSYAQEGCEFYQNSFSWAYLNFQLQSCLCRHQSDIPHDMDEKLQTLGYEGEPFSNLNTQEIEALFEQNAFFSCTKTGNRIVAFALKENGLDKDKFAQIEESITHAYRDAADLYGKSELLEMSYKQSIETLSVFRL